MAGGAQTRDRRLDRLASGGGLARAGGTSGVPAASNGAHPWPGWDASAALEQVELVPLMNLGQGRPDVLIGLIDGPVAREHPDLLGASIRTAPGTESQCRGDGAACGHGTFVAGILSARRGSVAPAVCPGCSLFVRALFSDAQSPPATPRATPEGLATAMLECMDAGARILNVSAALTAPASPSGEQRVNQALDLAARRGVLVVVAAGNQGLVGGSVMTRHRWVLSVVSYSRGARPMTGSNLGLSVGRNGLGAPGENITSLAPGGGTRCADGTSAATPFVTGTAALLWSQYPSATGRALRTALTTSTGTRRGVAPPLMNAWSAYQTLATSTKR